MPLSLYKKKKLRFIFIIFWVLLIYIVAALIWWFIALDTQNKQMTQYKIEQLKKDSSSYFQDLEKIQIIEKRKTTQYVGEGITFFLFIIAGAVFIFRAVRRQLKSGIQQQNFMMAVTHELKTPIAVTKLNLETLLKRKLEEGQQQQLLKNTVQEANRLNALCNNLLIVSQIEGGGYTITKENIDLSSIAKDCVEEAILRFPERKIQHQIVSESMISGDTLLLQMAFNNLIENAIKYSPKGSTIDIHLTNQNDKIIFSVKDEGKGIPENEKKKIFEKFYRLGNEATKVSKGTGLGLYLTKRIAKQHKANIFVTDNKPNGSIFTIEFKH